MQNRVQKLTLVAVVLLVVAQAAPALATSVGSQVAGNAAIGQDEERGVDSREAVEAFVDATMAEDLREHHVSGATVSVVKDGELLFSKGYGYADRRNRTPVVANRTLFRIGSVSKLFVWTGAMHQIENGTLDPDADVNRYLDRVRVPEKFGQPVTLEHLATHSAGFEEQLHGVAAESPADVRPLGETLQDLPARVRPPGVVTSYSNHGTALVGHVVARQANTTFPRYVDRRIYAPLNMTHSTFRQPVPDDVPGTLSNGYRYQQGEYVRGDFETIAIPPAGSMSATATDVAKFMNAHLQAANSPILSESATERMHRQQFANHPQLNGMAFGFYEQSRNGVRIVGHGGDTQLFHSGLWLFPERDLGVFVSYNSVGGVEAREEFIDSFTDHFFPADEPTPARLTAATVAADGDDAQAGPPLSAFTGNYRTTRISYTSFEKVAGLNTDFRVRRSGDGTLVTALPGQDAKRWARTGPTVFEQVDGDGEMAFRVEDGRASYVFFDSAAPQSFERIGWWETTLAQGGLLGAALLVVLSGIVGWPAAALWRRWRRWRGRSRPETDGRVQATGVAGAGGASAGSQSNESGRPRAARWLAGFAGLLGIGFLAGFVVIAASDPYNVVYRPASLRAVLALPLVYLVAALGAVAFAVLAWADRYWGLAGRIHYSLVAVALVVFLWQLSYWNLLGFWL